MIEFLIAVLEGAIGVSHAHNLYDELKDVRNARRPRVEPEWITFGFGGHSDAELGAILDAVPATCTVVNGCDCDGVIAIVVWDANSRHELFAVACADHADRVRAMIAQAEGDSVVKNAIEKRDGGVMGDVIDVEFDVHEGKD